MSELNEHRWAVMSERGCEATRLPYAEASELVRQLRGEDVRGLCVITDTAAGHLATAKPAPDKPAPDTNSKRPRRAAKK